MIFINEDAEEQGITTRQINDHNNTTMLNDSLLDNSMVHLNPATDNRQNLDNSQFQDFIDKELMNDLSHPVAGAAPSDSYLINDGAQTFQNRALRKQQLPLELLSLRDNKLDLINIKKLKNKLLEGAQIKKLDLSDNLLQDKGAKYLCEYFASNTTIEQLFVGNNGLTEVGAARLTDLFNVCPKLKVIGVAGNDRIGRIAKVCEKRGHSEEKEVQYM